MELLGLHPQLLPWAEHLVREARRIGLRVTITSVRRTREEQAKLYARYLAGLNTYPVAPPGRSSPELGLAWDMDVRDTNGRDAAPVVGAAWKSWGGRWSPADRVHFTV